MGFRDVLYLDMEDVIKAGGRDTALAIKSMEHVFLCQAGNDFVLPSKTVLSWESDRPGKRAGFINSMPAYIGGNYSMAGIKWIGSQPGNPERGLPQASAVIVLNDIDTKAPVAIMEGSVISSMRTAAVTAVAAKYLSLPEVPAVGLIGAGVVSESILKCLLAVRPGIKKAVVFDISSDRARQFAGKTSSELGVEVSSAESPEQAVRDMPVFVTATTSKEPVVKDEWIGKGAFYSQLAGYEAEIEVLVNSDKAVFDNISEVLHRGTSTLSRAIERGVYSADSAYGELKDIVSGSLPGREGPEERVFFKSVGMGIEDVAFATEILRNAEKGNIGRKLTFATSL